jgi:hypothetical protein
MIPKQLRKRQPDELVLATFRIPYEKWEKFQEAASASGTTASATLLAFIEDYLARFNAENQPELLDSVDSLDSLESQLETEVSENSVSQLTDRSELNPGLETQEVSGWNGDLPSAIDQQMQKLISEKIAAKFEDFEPIINRIQSQVGQLSKRLDKVEQIVNKFKGDKKTKASELIDVEAVPIDSDLIDSDLNENDVESDTNPAEYDEFDVGLTQTALCIEFGINPTTLNRHASVRGLSTVEYLHQLTGWLYRNGKYYPPK